MKKHILFLSLLIVLFSSAVSAQVRKGFRAGVTVSNWTGDAAGTMNDIVDVTNGVLQTTSKAGFYAGGYVQVPLGDFVSVEPGIYYAQKGYTLNGDLSIDKLNFLGANAQARVNAHYIDVPVLLKVEPVKGLQLFAGPQVSFLAKSDLRLQAGVFGINLLNKTLDMTDDFKRVDLGLSGGIGYQFENGFNVMASYDRGLSKLDQNERFKAYNQVVKVGIGFSF